MNSGTSSASPSLRILIVENHDDTLTMLEKLLKRRGHEIFLATTMEEALQVLQVERIDVLLSDIGLPDGDGWELLQRSRHLGQMFSIAISGYGSTADKLKSSDAGFRHHLVKPFVVVELDAVLEEAAQKILQRVSGESGG